MIADTFIRRPNTAIVISLIIVILGIVSIISLPVSQYPDITPPVVQVSANYTGANAQVVEETVATPIESQVNGVPGMSYIQSNSTSTGSMGMSVTFKIGTDINIAALDVENRVNAALPNIPDEVKALGTIVRKRTPSILMVIGVYSPGQTHGIQFVDNYPNIYIREALLRVPGVGDVFVRADPFGMRLWLNPDKLANLRITASDVLQAVREQNVQVAAGTIGAPPQQNYQAFEYTCFVEGRLASEKEFGNIVVKTNPQMVQLCILRMLHGLSSGNSTIQAAHMSTGRGLRFCWSFSCREAMRWRQQMAYTQRWKSSVRHFLQILSIQCRLKQSR